MVGDYWLLVTKIFSVYILGEIWETPKSVPNATHYFHFNYQFISTFILTTGKWLTNTDPFSKIHCG
jgi:hypothetical protein